MYVRALVWERQGDASTTDLVVTTTEQTALPSNTNAHKNSVPEIGGSEGGFIGLVVGLGVIFLVSCAVIFFLLRNWQHGGRTIQRSFPPSDSTSAGGGFRNAIRNTFTKSGEIGVESGPEPARRGGTLFGFRRNQRSGWVRAPGEDDPDITGPTGGDVWDPRDHIEVEELQYDAPPLKLERRASPSDFSPSSQYTPPTKPKHFRDPFEHVKAQHERSDSVESGETMVSPSSTLPGGTKFKEDL